MLVSPVQLSFLSAVKVLGVSLTPLSVALITTLKSPGPMAESGGDTSHPSPPPAHGALTTAPWLCPSGQLLLHQITRPSQPGLSNLEIRMSCGAVSRASREPGHSRAYKSGSPGAEPCGHRCFQPNPSGSAVPGVLGVALCDRGTFQGPLVLQGPISTEGLV